MESCTIVLFGASGDLTQRMVMPAIFRLWRRGLLSPEFHLYFTEPLHAERVAATGFFDGVIDRPTSAEQDADVKRMFAEFAIEHLIGRPFRQLRPASSDSSSSCGRS